MADAVLTSARFGDVDALRAALQGVDAKQKDALVNFVQDGSENTPLHMACANGHADCVKELLANGARHLPNASGNFPLHWAVQNKHIEIVKLLLEGVPDIDVLAQNGFGRGSVTEAFQFEDTEILAVLLEHKSASEERLAAGSDMDNVKVREEDEEGDAVDGDDSTTSPKIIQETVMELSFDASLPTLKARELALDWDREAFGSKADEDITGVSIWSAALILSRWIIAHRDEFEGKQVCELGSGCGVSGLAAALYTNAARVVLSDLFDHTIRNLEHNVGLNRRVKARAGNRVDSEEKGVEPEDEEEQGCARCGAVQRFSADNPEGKLMKCGGCRSVAYCSRECQKKAWKSHKTECKAIRARREQEERLAEQEQVVEVAAIDWSRPETWPTPSGSTPAKFEMLLGSDLVYHQDMVAILGSAVDGLLSDEGKFVLVACDERHSLVDFRVEMEARGFECSVEVVPDAYKQNPIVNNAAAAELFSVHFHEMSDVYGVYTFTRRQA